MSNLDGVMVPIITPLTKQEKVNEADMRRLVCYLLEGGIHSIFVMGSAGEFACLMDEEKTKAVEVVVDEVNGKVPVIMGTGDCSTKRVIQNTKLAKKLGADFAMPLFPYYFEMRQEWIYNFYREVTQEAELPILLYNVPVLPGMVNIEVDTVKRLSKIDGVMGMKNTSNFEHLYTLVQKRPSKDFRILNGIEAQFLPALLVGADGGVLGPANVAPKLCVQIYEKAKAGDYVAARALQEKFISLVEIIYDCESTLGGLKTAVSLLGICDETITKPMVNPTKKQKEAIKEQLKRSGLLG